MNAPSYAASGSSAEQSRKFLENVLVWPGSAQAPGWINVHVNAKNSNPSDTSAKNNGGKPWVVGWPFKTVDGVVDRINWVSSTDTFFNVWVCMSQQSDMKETTVNGKRKKRAVRKAANATWLKAIWIDCDVKPGDPKHYHTMSDAFDALDAFRDKVGLPFPSMIVNSGGGLHVYWISDTPMSPAEWRPYADGLKALLLREGVKCDAGLTTDAARILRVPGTLNHKYNPPRPVELLHLGKQYNFGSDLASLKDASVAVVRSALHTLAPPVAPIDSEAVFDAPHPAFAGLAPDAALQADIEPRGVFLVDPVPIFADDGCPFLRDALRTGGKDYSEPMWNLTTLAATFLANGNALAHGMGCQHQEYTPESTEEKWTQKLQARANSELGWPSCDAIKAAGCTKCAACPHFGRVKSPLNLTLPDATHGQKESAFDRPNVGDQTKEETNNPVTVLLKLRDQGADINTLLSAMNETFAVVKYGSKIVVASIVGRDLDFMKLADFHNMLANLVVYKEVDIKDDSGATQKTTRSIIVSKSWFKWKQRRQYVSRGAVFEPGSALAVPDDMLNMWRGFGVEPKQGDWTLMRDHIRDVICSGNEEHFRYVIGWMAYGVQHPQRPIGVAIALRGEEGAGKGFLWRNYGKLFGKNFRHVAQGEHLTGRFNAVLAETCAVFLDEALWAGDRKGEQILKALITEETFQLERKTFDPIPVKNRLRLMIASNNQWIVPIGTKGRRYAVFDVSDKYSDERSPEHKAYWEKLQADFGDEAPDDGRSAMLFDLLRMDLSNFNVRAVPNSTAKTEQKLLSLKGAKAWLYSILQEAAIGHEKWNEAGAIVSKDQAYSHYEAFSKQRREWQPETRDMWSKAIHAALGPTVADTRPTIGNVRIRSLRFVALATCREQFARHIGDPGLEWETENEPDIRPEDAHADIEWEHEDDGPLHDEWEPELEPVDEPGGALPDA